MFIDFDVYSEKVAQSQSVQDFLEHFGVRGMRWGVRRDPRTGIRPLAKTISESKPGQVAIKRGQTHKQSTPEKKVNSFIREHRKGVAITAAVTAVGATFAVGYLAHKGQQKFKALSAAKASKKAADAHLAKVMETGFAWKKDNGPWHYGMSDLKSGRHFPMSNENYNRLSRSGRLKFTNDPAKNYENIEKGLRSLQSRLRREWG